MGIENTVSKNNSAEFVAYIGHELKILNSFSLNYGIRFNRWSNYGEAFVVNYKNNLPISYDTYEKGERYYANNSIEPRVGISYKLSEYSSLKMSYNRNVQHINLINNSISPFNSLEVWLPSSKNINPQKADIFNLGYVRSISGISTDINVDVFYKSMYEQIGYSYHASTLLNPLLEGELRQGDGTAYGFEIFVKKKSGRFTGQIGYSFTRSNLQIDGLNGNRQYKARQDKPVDFSVGMSYEVKPRWLATTNFMYSSGLMITTPTSFYYYRGTQLPVYTAQNNSRMPDYKRFDIGSDFRLNKTKGKFEHHLVISIYNLFNFQNPAFMNFTKIEKDGEFVIPADIINLNEQVPTIRYVFAIVPSINYTLKF